MLQQGGGLASVVESIIAQARKNCAPRPERGDYEENGIMHCGICHEPLQMSEPVIMLGKPVEKLPRMCRCQREQAEQEDVERKRAMQRDRIEALKKASLMDKRFEDSTFSTFSVTQDNEKNMRRAKRYVENFGYMREHNQGLLLYGEPGTGKTFMAACIANALMEQGVPVMMTSFVKLMSLIKTNTDEQNIIQRMNNAELLIVDDLGTERSTDTAIEKVYDFVDSRYRSKKPMILTTNMSLDDIKSAKDIRFRRIYDRVIECCYPMEFTGKSWRMKEARERFTKTKSILEGT